MGAREEVEPQRHRGTEKTKTAEKEGTDQADQSLLSTLLVSSLCLCASVVQNSWWLEPHVELAQQAEVEHLRPGHRQRRTDRQQRVAAEADVDAAGHHELVGEDDQRLRVRPA